MIRILIATYSRLIGDAIRTVLERQSDLNIVACVTTAEEIEQLVSDCQVLLVTPRLGTASVLELIGDLHTAYPDLKILLIAAKDEAEVIVTYMEAGAAGYVLGDESIHSLVKKVRGAHQEKAFVSPHVAGELIARITELAHGPYNPTLTETRLARLSQLTPREREVIALLARGHTNDQIAAELIISKGTAKNHVHNILKKLEVSSRTDAADLYRRHLGQAGAAPAAAPRATP